MLVAGDRFELPVLRAYETGVVTALPAIKNGADLLILTTITGGHPRAVNTNPHKNLERDERIELSTSTWKDDVLPLN